MAAMCLNKVLMLVYISRSKQTISHAVNYCEKGVLFYTCVCKRKQRFGAFYKNISELRVTQIIMKLDYSNFTVLCSCYANGQAFNKDRMEEIFQNLLINSASE